MHVIFHANGVDEIHAGPVGDRYTIEDSIHVVLIDGADVHLHIANGSAASFQCRILDSGALVITVGPDGRTFGPHAWAWINRPVSPDQDRRHHEP